MKKLYCIRGASGAGKTTYAKSLGLKHHFEADDYFMIDGVYCFLPQYLPQAHAQCLQKTKDAMQTGEDIVVANTFTQEWEMKPYLDLAEKYGYTVFTVIIENRHGNKDIHNVPQETRQKQAERLSKSIKLI